MNKPFEFKNRVRQSWVLCDELTTDTRERLKCIPKKQRLLLYKDIDKEVVACYNKKLADINKQHYDEGLCDNSVVGIRVSHSPTEINSILAEAASEVLQQMQL